ncbi:MAG: lipopolysaccharide kinase InaA family protein, partial [Thermodesulfobacteriota bacterium]
MDGRQFQWIRVRRRNLHGLIDPVLKPLLDGGFFDDPVRQVALRQGQVVKDTRVRWAAIVPLGEGKGLFVKRFRVLGRWQSYKYRIAPSRVRREWRISRFLSTRAILTPRPLGVLERREHGLIKESLFMAEALEGGMDLLTFSEDLLRKPKGPEKRDQVLGLLAETTRKIHDAGLFHRDLHGGNFLVVEAPPLSLYLVDLHHARRLPWVPRGKRLWNIAQIYKSLDSVLDEEARRSFLAAYGGGCSPLGDDPDRSQRRIQGMMRTMARRHEKSRAKRCLKESSVFTRERRAGFVVFRRREVKGGDLVEILRSHRQMVEGQGEKLL